ncbi:MAG: glycosyltransferase family 9 protein [Candidatus Latescibacterota bacterium]
MIPTDSNRVLLAIRLRQLGDVLATISVLQAVKRSGIAQTVVFVVDGHYHELLAGFDGIDMLLPEPPSVTGMSGLNRYTQYAERLRNLRASWALDFHSNPRSALIAYLSGAPQRVGFDVRMRKWLYTDCEPRAVYQNGRTVARTSQENTYAIARRLGLDVPVPKALPRLTPGAEAVRRGREALQSIGIDEAALKSRKIIALNPGNPYPAKAWPADYFACVADELGGRGYRIIIIWGPGERDNALSIQSRCKEDVVLAPPLPLASLPGFLSNLSLLVTIDSGLKHLAVCVRIPTVTLFGPTSPHEWHMGGRLDGCMYRGLSCSPCRLLRCPFGSPCMTQLTPVVVMQQIDHLLERMRDCE